MLPQAKWLVGTNLPCSQFRDWLTHIRANMLGSIGLPWQGVWPALPSSAAGRGQG